MSKFIKISIAVLLLLITTTNPVMAKAPTYIPQKVLSVSGTIAFYAQYHGVSNTELQKVAMCESSLNPKAIGDSGRAVNIFQYHKPTFISFSKLMGEELDYYSYNDQARLTAWIWKHKPSYKSHWTCYTKIYS